MRLGPSANGRTVWSMSSEVGTKPTRKAGPARLQPVKAATPRYTGRANAPPRATTSLAPASAI